MSCLVRISDQIFLMLENQRPGYTGSVNDYIPSCRPAVVLSSSEHTRSVVSSVLIVTSIKTCPTKIEAPMPTQNLEAFIKTYLHTTCECYKQSYVLKQEVTFNIIFISRILKIFIFIITCISRRES